MAALIIAAPFALALVLLASSAIRSRLARRRNLRKFARIVDKRSAV